MATSAQTLLLIIDELLKAKPANRTEAITLLSAKGYLPKKLLSKPKTEKEPSVFASKAAQDFAEANDIVLPNGFKGTAAKDKVSVSDLKKLKSTPVKKINGSPSALKFARDNGINIDDLVGSGEDGKILLKDVKSLKIEEPGIPEDKDESDAGPSSDSSVGGKKISAAAAKAIAKYGIDEGDIEDIEGTGKNGEILLKDLKEYIDLFCSEKGMTKNDSDED